MKNFDTNKLLSGILLVFIFFASFLPAQELKAPHTTLTGQKGFEGFSFDSGWQGGEVGVGIYFRFAVSVTGILANIEMDGKGTLEKNGLERDWNLYFKGDSGKAKMDFGFSSAAQYKLTIDIGVIEDEYIGDLPLLPNVDLRFQDEKNITPYSLDSPINLMGTVNQSIIDYSFGIPEIFEANAGFSAYGTAYQTLSGNSLSTDKGVFTSEGERKLHTIEPETFSVNSITESIHSSLDFSLTPVGNIGVTVLFVDYNIGIPIITIEANADESDFSTSSANILFNVPKLDPPVLAFPINDAYRQSLSPWLSWQPVDSAVSYTLLVDTNSSFTDPIVFQYLTDTAQQLSGLGNNVKYYWKVKAHSEVINASDYSEPFYFTTKLITPTLYYPSNDTMGIETNPVFTWSAIPGADHYRLEVNTAANFSGSIIFDNSITDTAQIVNLDFARHYYWRVTATNTYGNASDVSDIFHFSTRTTQNPVLSWPVDGATVYSLNQAFSWFMDDYNGFPFIFDVQYSIDSTFASGVKSDFGIDAYQTLSDLANGALHYFWRVRSQNNSGFYSQWVTEDFKTDTSLLGAPKVVLTWPIDNNTVYTPNPDLSWFLSSSSIFGALSYDLKYADLTAGTPYTFIDSIPTIFYQLSGLIAGHQYSWSVRSNNSGNQSEFSEPETFIVNAGQGGAPLPVLSWPVNNATVYSGNPVLYWYLSAPAAGPITYNVNVFDVTNGNTLVFDSTGISSSSLLLPITLEGGNTYSWTVETVNGVSQSGASDPEYFIVNGSSAAAPSAILSWPVGGTTIYGSDATLLWYLSGTASGTILYDVELVDSSAGTTVTYSSLSAAYLPVTGLIAGHLYKWRVNTFNSTSGSYSGYTDFATFILDGGTSGNPVPKIAWPALHTTVYSLTPTLTWYLTASSLGIITYNLEIKPVSVPFDSTDLISGLAVNFYTLVSALDPGTAYHWRVQLISSSEGPSAWSDEDINGGAFFTTYSSPDYIVAPLVGGPDFNMIINSSSAALSWFLPAVPKAGQTYKLEVAHNTAMNNPILVEGNLVELNKTISLLNAGTYYWRVQANSIDGKYSAYSPVAKFKVGLVTGIETDENNIPASFSLEQNYPNPFNPSTIIKYSLPEAANVNIRVYDMLGSEVKMLVNDFKSSGVYNIAWNGENNSGHKVTSGTYIYRIIAGGYIKTMKMILLK